MRRFNPEWLNRPRKHQNPEARLLLSIIKYLHLTGWYVGKIKTKAAFTSKGTFIKDRYQMVGLPDAFAFKDGVMLAIETKIGNNTQTEAQIIFQKHFHKPPNRLYLVIRSLEELQENLKKYLTK